MSRLEHPVSCAGKRWISSRSLDSAKVYGLSPRGRFRTRRPWVFFPIRCILFFHQLLCLACGKIILRNITYVKSGTYFYVEQSFLLVVIERSNTDPPRSTDMPFGDHLLVKLHSVFIAFSTAADNIESDYSGKNRAISRLWSSLCKIFRPLRIRTVGG